MRAWRLALPCPHQHTHAPTRRNANNRVEVLTTAITSPESRHFFRRKPPTAFALIFSGLLAGMSSMAMAQDTLQRLIETALTENPASQAEMANLRASARDIEAADYLNYPNLSVQTENNGRRTYAQINIEQPVWNGGKISAQKEIARAQHQLQRHQAKEVHYRLALSVAEAWVALAQAHERSKVLGQTIERLASYRSMMQRRIDAQLSPAFELALLDSRTFSTRIEYAKVASAQKTAQMRLQQLIGRDLTPEESSPQALQQTTEHLPLEILTDPAPVAVKEPFSNHPTVLKAKSQAEISRLQVKLQDSSKSPEVFVRLQQALAAPAQVPQQTVFLGLRYQPGPGFSSWAQSQAASERAVGLEYSAQSKQQEIEEANRSDRFELQRAQEQSRVLAQAIANSDTLRESYQRQFIAGRRSWQDLLNAEKEHSDNALALTDIQALLTMTAYRMSIRLGMMPWQQ